MKTQHWEGIIAIEDEWTSDGRKCLPGSLSFRALPLALITDGDEQQIIGRIDTIEKKENDFHATGIVFHGIHLPDGLGLQADMDRFTGDRDGETLIVSSARIVAAHVGSNPAWSRCTFRIIGETNESGE